MKLVSPIKICINETYSKICTGKYLSDTFPIQNGLKKGHALSPTLLNFAFEQAIRKYQENQEEMELSGMHQLLVYADITFLSENINTIKQNEKTILETCKNIGLEVNSGKTKYMFLSFHQNIAQNHDLLISNKHFKNVAKFKYLKMTVIKFAFKKELKTKD
jgi:hypothetical protein